MDYNVGRIHKTLRFPPATEGGISSRLWAVRGIADTREHSTLKARRERIAHLADQGIGNAPHRGTAYDLLLGVTEYVDHETRASKSQKVSRRFFYQTLGAGAAVKERALTDLVAYAQARAS